MGNQASALSAEDDAVHQALRNGRNARVLDLPLELSAADSRSSGPEQTSEAPEPLVPRDEATSAPAASPAAPRRRIEDFYDVQSETLGRWVHFDGFPRCFAISGGYRTLTGIVLIHWCRGHYATVCCGRCRRSGRRVAVKKIKRFLTDPKRLRAEIAALRRVKQHPNIVELIDVFETTREVHLVLELCTGGELFERLAEKGAYSEADCVRHVRDMARAVQYLHECGIVHRDLKPENILLSTPDDHDAVVKVADFGLAKVFAGTSLKTKCGTWGYSAPEMISGSGSTFGYDDKVNSWSLGTILYILLCGYHPFDPEGERSDNDMIASIQACSFEFDADGWATISDSAKDLVRHLLVLDPDDRFSMKQVLDHAWITGTATAAAELPLSPTIHHELAKYQEHTKQKSGFGSYEDQEDDAATEQLK